MKLLNKEDKYKKYYSKYWYLGTLLITSIAYTSFIGLEVYKIFNAYNLDNSLDTKNTILVCALSIIIGSICLFPISIINYAVEYYKRRNIQLILIIIELFLMMYFMLKLLFCIL